MRSIAFLLAAALLAAAAAADTATSASGPNAAAFATDYVNSSYVKTGRRRHLAQDPSLAAAATGGGMAWSSGDGKTIGAGGGGPGADKAGPCRSGSTATYGPNAFAFTSGPGGPSAPFIAWGPRPSGAAAPAPLTVCPGSIIQFAWEGADPARGVTQVAGPGCPPTFGPGEKGQKVIAAPSAAGSVGVRATKPGKLYFADPGDCANTLTAVEVLKP